MTSIPYEIAWAERDAFMQGIAERLDDEKLQSALREQADKISHHIVEELEYAIEDYAVLNAADSVRCQAERMACELLQRVMLGDEDAFLHLIGSTPWLRSEGRRRFPFEHSSKFREAILNKHRNLFVSEIIADCEAKAAWAEQRKGQPF